MLRTQNKIVNLYQPIAISLIFLFYIFTILLGFESLIASILFFIIFGIITYALNPFLWGIFSIIILIFIPAEANIFFTGVSYLYSTGGINFHILTYFTFGGFISWLFIFNKKRLFRIDFVRKQLKIFFLMVAIEVFIEILHIRKNSGMSNQLPDVYIGPILFYFLFLSIINSKEKLNLILKFFLILILVLSVLGIIEYLRKSDFYLAALMKLQNVGWYEYYMRAIRQGNAYRIMTTLGHPLTNGAYFITSFIFLLYFTTKEASFFKSFITFLVFIAIVLTLSRAAFILAILGALWIFFSNKKITKSKLIIIILVLGISVGFLLEPILSLLFSRGILFGDSSAAVRFTTLKVFLNNIFSISIIGFGPKNLDDAIRLLFRSSTAFSLEIGYIIVLLQYGVIFLGLYIYGILLPVIEKKKKYLSSNYPEITPFYISVLLLFIYFAASNTIGVRSSINYLFFFVLSLLSLNIILKLTKESI